MNFSVHPFKHWVIDDFFSPKRAKRLSEEFLPLSDKWHHYSNYFEEKFANKDLDTFPSVYKEVFNHLMGNEFMNWLTMTTGELDLVPDTSLYGGGLHTHSRGGKLNVHLDYSLHPENGMERKYNLIVYLSEGWKPEWGGALEFWEGDETAPSKKAVSVDCLFNRAVLFDTSTNSSWHGFNDPITCPEGHQRNSIALYYLAPPSNSANPSRKRAKFAPVSGKEAQIMERYS